MTGQLIPALTPAYPEIFLALATMGLLMFGVFRGSGRLIGQLTLLILLCTGFLLLGHIPEREVTFNGLFVMDQFAVLAKTLVLVGCAFSVILSVGYLEHERIERFEFLVLVLFATLGMFMMISANDLIALYVGLELQSLALYVLAAFRRDVSRSSEAGVKYFVLGALSSGFLLYGASLIYGFTGSTNFEHIAVYLADHNVSDWVIIGVVFLTTGLAFKLSAVPFHMWTPDVYEGAPGAVTAFFAIAPKIAALSLVIRLVTGPFAELGDQWQQMFYVLSLASMVVGGLAAIGQANIKRLMAYSAIGHIGYALVGLASGGQSGVQASLVYMTIYMMMTAGTFAVIMCMRHKGQLVEDIEQLAGLSRSHPLLALAMAVFMFSMAGIPPLAGFFGKLYVFLAAVESGLIWLAIIGVVTSVIAAYYYLRIVKLMYFDEPGPVFDQQGDDSITATLLITAGFTGLFFLLPVTDYAHTAAAALYAS